LLRECVEHLLERVAISEAISGAIREAIPNVRAPDRRRGNPWSSGVINGNQWSSEHLIEDEVRLGLDLDEKVLLPVRLERAPRAVRVRFECVEQSWEQM
jgi:hypothetical protein